MNDDPSHIWTSVELHNRYNELSMGNDALSRREISTKLQNHFGNRLVKLDICGCASLFCFKDHLPGNLRLEKVDDNEENIMMAKLTDKITAECRDLPQTQNYDIGMFRKAKTIENTSSTLLSFISGLVSNGKLSRAPLPSRNRSKLT